MSAKDEMQLLKMELLRLSPMIEAIYKAIVPAKDEQVKKEEKKK